MKFDNIHEKRVCIIGAGPSGLAALNAFLSIQKHEDYNIPQLICYEKQSKIGGLWNYTWRTGINEYGDIVPNSMYRHLWINAPKECLEFADYTFDEHFNHPIPSYPPREVLYDYITGRMKHKHDSFEQYIQFNAVVQKVEYDAVTHLFKVDVLHHHTNEQKQELFDYVICCSGHFSVPNVPDFDGLDTFEGSILHAHDVRDVKEFAGQNVLIVGSSYSAEDIALQCYKFEAKTITLSYHTSALQFKWPESVRTVPLLKKVMKKTCYFQDETVIHGIDTIILCTGYRHHFPFMSNDLRLNTANLLYPETLYDGIFWPTNPKLIYLGMQNQFFSFPMFDVQAWYARDYVLGEIELPNRDIMAKEYKGWTDRQSLLGMDHTAAIYFQADYVEHILKKSNYPVFDVQAMAKCFIDWETNKDVNILTYRDHRHTSVITGTEATPHSLPWLKEFDDSMSHFLEINA